MDADRVGVSRPKPRVSKFLIDCFDEHRRLGGPRRVAKAEAVVEERVGRVVVASPLSLAPASSLEARKLLQ